MDRSQAELDRERERNQRSLLGAEAAALLLLNRRRSEVATAGVRAGRSLTAIASDLERATSRSVVESRALARFAGIYRLQAEAGGLGFGIPRNPNLLLAETLRDVARAKRIATNFADHWLAKATGKTPGASAAAANVATKSRIETIARSEASEAFNSGRSRSVELVSIELLRVWNAEMAKNTCSICRNADGTIVGAREPFPQGEPGGVHPRCGCSWQIIGTSERRYFREPTRHLAA